MTKVSFTPQQDLKKKTLEGFMNRQQRRAAKALARRQGTQKARDTGTELIMSWYESEEEFEKAKKLDPNSYEGKTYEEMNAFLEEALEHYPTAVKVPIRVDDYAAWCRDNNETVGAISRLSYINKLFYGR
jgi:hypothetical protein